ncbi:MAG: thioredoxin family protein [Alistipes sp.]|nr:thioredoxin family protein [Alistipes sp.]
MKFFMRISAVIAALITVSAAAAQTPTVKWKSEAKSLDDGLFEIVLDGKVESGWHTYDLHSGYSSTAVRFSAADGCVLEGEPYEINEPTREGDTGEYYDRIVLGQKVSLSADKALVTGSVTWMSCKGTECGMPEEWSFSVELKGGGETAYITAEEPVRRLKKPFDWSLLVEAVLWGFAALLTPCVFPMVPMTVSFFIKGSENKAAGRAKALTYGLFIIALYTLPIAAIILITRFVGGDSVTADIFNWLATHWIPNVIFFIVFMIFAASFFGAFEITLPSSLVNKSDRNSDKGGIVGIFFMALTLVLVSFSCTGPIVGSVLIKSTAGEFLQPIITMLAFSMAFALPFTLFALFPSLLKSLPKSGGWLNSVKVVLGFIEVALGFKFLSVADQTYHWGLLDREVYLAIWIVCFSLLGLYLLGKIRFAHDSQTEHLTVTRLALSIAVFTFVVYMIPGMWGAPLKALSGYLPPIHTQDFVMGKYSAAAEHSDDAHKVKYGDNLHLPHGLDGYFELGEAMAAAERAGKPVFVDITGHGCVNCREMEARVWSDPEVLSILRNDYIVVALYTDDKMSVPAEDWITTDSGDTLKSLGRINSYIARTRFGVNAQPNYILIAPDGEQLAPARGYDLSVEGFVKFLKSGLEAYDATK